MKSESPPVSYLNGTWVDNIGATHPEFYLPMEFSWGVGASTGEGSMIIDLGPSKSWKNLLTIPGEGGWHILKITVLDKSTAQLDVESFSKEPNGPAHLELKFHFLSADKFWLEASENIYNNVGPDNPWYRLSGPDQPPLPPPKRPRRSGA